MNARFLPTRLIWQLLAALILMVVGAHALTPAHSPFERAAGSAFSATTYEVAIDAAPGRLVKAELRLGSPPPAHLTAFNRSATVDRQAVSARGWGREFPAAIRDRPIGRLWSTGPPAA